MSSALTVRSLGSARVTDASDNLTLIVTSGNAFASATPVPGKAVDIEVGTGNIELWLPAAVSADVAADVVQRGQVTVVHSVLPRAVGPGRTRYRAKVNGGLSPVRLLTRTGQVLIQQPQ